MNAPEAAKALVAARLSGAGLDKMPHGVPLDGSTADGYHIQDAMITLLGAPLGALVGWKIGATNAAAQASMGFGPFYGPLFASAQLADGDSASLSALGASFKASEAEFAFVMKTDLPPRSAPYSEEEVWGAVAAVAPAIELASARLLFAAPPVAVLADGAWNGCFVLGRRVPPSAVPGGAASLASAGAALLVNGAEVAANTGANVLGNPLTALTWLANALSAAKHTLAAGQVVMTGAATAHKALVGGDVLTARFTGVAAEPLLVSVCVKA